MQKGKRFPERFKKLSLKCRLEGNFFIKKCPPSVRLGERGRYCRLFLAVVIFVEPFKYVVRNHTGCNR